MTDVNLQVGSCTISRVEESYGALFPIDMLLPAWDRSALDDHGPAVMGQFLDLDEMTAFMSIHTWVVRTPSSTVLIDTCAGNHKNRPAMEGMHMLDTPWLANLAAVGIDPEEVDTVICTHLHVDHVGWNTSLVDGEWVPTFPNATYHINSTELGFWQSEESDAIVINENVFEDSVQPLLDRDLVQLWDDDAEIDGIIRLETRPGHTPGNAIAILESGDDRAVFAGDTMHSPIQVFEPTWNAGFDLEADAAIAARRSVLETCAEHNSFLLPAHFAAPHVYRVEERGDGLAAVSAI